MEKESTPQSLSLLWAMLLLVVAFGLRTISITSLPPGLTHDEAVHGISAWSIVEGARPLYLSVANGREPLYDYAVAGMMAFLGPTAFALRITSILFSMLLTAGIYALVRHLFGRRVALLTLTFFILSFWPLMISRHALRTITMPALHVLGMLFWIGGVRWGVSDTRWVMREGQSTLTDTARRRSHTASALLAGLLLGLSFYTYIPSRITWLLLPWMLFVWYIWNRELFQKMLPPTLITLGTMTLVAAPLMSYLYIFNPEAEVRVSELAGPLASARAGEWEPLLTNFASGIRFVISVGDPAWRYNIAERPLFTPFLAALFGLGLIMTLFPRLIGLQSTAPHPPIPPPPDPSSDIGDRTPDTAPPFSLQPSALILLWLFLGLLPVFITGSWLGTTQAVAAMPVIYIFPALFIDWLWSKSPPTSPLPIFVVIFLMAYVGLDTFQAYFVTWGQHPEVRLQYEAPLVDTLSRAYRLDDELIVFSVDQPGPFHDGAVTYLTSAGDTDHLRLFNGSRSLLLPAEGQKEIWIYESSLTPIDPRLAKFLGIDIFGELETQRINFFGEAVVINDVEQFRTRNRIAAVRQAPSWEEVQTTENTIQFSDLIQLKSWAIDQDEPLSELSVITSWEILDRPDQPLVFFTQLLRNGEVIAQEDRLDAPTSQWQAGDRLFQLHRLPSSQTIMPHDQLIIGIYYIDGQSTLRLPVTIDGTPSDDFFTIR